MANPKDPLPELGAVLKNPWDRPQPTSSNTDGQIRYQSFRGFPLNIHKST